MISVVVLSSAARAAQRCQQKKRSEKQKGGDLHRLSFLPANLPIKKNY